MALSQKAKEILNRQDLIAKRNLWYERMQTVIQSTDSEWNRKHVFAVMGINGKGKHDFYTEPELWVEECLEDLAARCNVLENDNYFCPLCVQLDFYGVHYLDKMLGAELFFQDAQWYNRYLTTPIGNLQAPDLKTNELWALTKRALEAFLKADVALPCIGLPAISSPLNVAVNLYGGEFMVEMLCEPENAMKDLTLIAELQCEIHRLCREMVPADQLQCVACDGRNQLPGYGQLCGCTTQLLSGELYAEMIAPLDEKLLSVYPNGGMIHLCGSHTQHIESFRKMKSLTSVQINDRASDDLQAYFEGLRDDQIIYFCPCEKVPLEKALEITGGKRLIVVGHQSGPIYK